MKTPPSDIMAFIQTADDDNFPPAAITPPVPAIGLKGPAPTVFQAGVVQSAATAQAPVKPSTGKAKPVIGTALEDTGRPPGAANPVPSTAPSGVVIPQPVLTSVATTDAERKLEQAIFGGPVAAVVATPPVTYAPLIPLNPAINPAQMQQIQQLFQPPQQFQQNQQSGSSNNYQAFIGDDDSNALFEHDGEDDQDHMETTPVASASVQMVATPPLAPVAHPPVVFTSQQVAELSKGEPVFTGQLIPPSVSIEVGKAIVVPNVQPQMPVAVACNILSGMPEMPSAVKGLFNLMSAENDLADSAVAIKQIENDAIGLWHHLGMSILENPKNYNQAAGNKLHEVLFLQRWDPDQLLKIGPHRLCVLENVLTTHQVWVQGLENEWKARFRVIGNELDRLSFRKRDFYSGTKVAIQEQKMFEAEQNMRTLRLEYVRAWSMHSLLEGLAERFAQLENGLKRTISLISSEFLRTK